MATNIGFCSFSTDDGTNVQFLTSVTPADERFGFPKGETVTHGYRKQGNRQVIQTSITGFVQAHHFDLNKISAGYAQYLTAFEKLNVQQVDELVAKERSLEAFIDPFKLTEPDYLQSVILEKGDDIGEELLHLDEFSSKRVAKYMLVVQAHSARVNKGDWITPLDTQYHAEVKLLAEDAHSDLGPQFDDALRSVISNYVSENITDEIKQTLEHSSQFKYIIE